jgi:hypothetical protein
MDPATRTLLADVAASLLLLGAFGVLAAILAALWFVWKGLREARRQLKPGISRVVDIVQDVEVTTHQTAEEVVLPPIRVASALAGLRAGARAFMGSSDESSSGPPL